MKSISRKYLLFITVLYEWNLIFGELISQGKCNEPLNLYENLNCNPIYSSDKNGNKKLCPDCFDCTQINPVVNKCYYEGRYYPIGQRVDKCANLPNCYAECTCTDALTFECPVFDCARVEDPTGDCYYVSGLNGCCPHLRCPDNNTYVCNINGHKYYEGQLFPNPQDPCSTCECASGVTGDPGDPNCKKNVCPVELYQSNLILGYCAPIYSSLGECCPNNYICPRDDDVFLGSCGDNEPDNQSVCVTENCKQCRYGKRYYDIGTRFKRTEKNGDDGQYITTKCECKIPPYFTCTQDFSNPK